MNPFQVHADALKALQNEMEDDCPVLIWKTNTIKILPGGVVSQSKNSMGGFSLDSDFAFTCLTLDFSSMPASNETITYLGKSLKIVSVTVAAGGLQLRIAANHAAQGL